MRDLKRDAFNAMVTAGETIVRLTMQGNLLRAERDTALMEVQELKRQREVAKFKEQNP